MHIIVQSWEHWTEPIDAPGDVVLQSRGLEPGYRQSLPDGEGSSQGRSKFSEALR